MLLSNHFIFFHPFSSIFIYSYFICHFTFYLSTFCMYLLFIDWHLLSLLNITVCGKVSQQSLSSSCFWCSTRIWIRIRTCCNIRFFFPLTTCSTFPEACWFRSRLSPSSPPPLMWFPPSLVSTCSFPPSPQRRCGRLCSYIMTLVVWTIKRTDIGSKPAGN